MIQFACRECGKPVRVKDEYAGRKGKCPSCGKSMMVPGKSPVGGSTKGSGVSFMDQETAGGTDTNTKGAGDPAQQESKETLLAFLAPAQEKDELGRLGPYRILKILGAGGMGAVFHAEDPKLKRQIALKVMLPALAASELARQRFLREAQATAALDHDHIVSIYQVGEDRGVPFIAMPFLQGEPLDKRLQREKKPALAEVLRIGRELLEGLAAAHERGLIHRDIKPANVWLEGKRARVKILDFGLARVADDQTSLTQSGALLGTPAYMAPEQANGKAVDGRADLFSVGCVLYRMATGTMPFKGQNLLALISALAMDTPPAPKEVDRKVPPALSDLIMKLLEKRPADRPADAQTAEDALAELEKKLERGEPMPGARETETAPSTLTALTEPDKDEPRSKRVRRDAEDDDRPLRKRPAPKKKKRKRNMVPLILMGGGVVLALVVSVSALAVLLGNKSPAPTSHADAGVPTQPTATQPTGHQPNPSTTPSGQRPSAFKQLHALEIDGMVQAAGLAPDGSTAVAWVMKPPAQGVPGGMQPQGALAVYDLKTGKPITSAVGGGMPAHMLMGGVTAIDVSADNRRALMTSTSGVFIVEVFSQRPVAHLHGYTVRAQFDGESHVLKANSNTLVRVAIDNPGKGEEIFKGKMFQAPMISDNAKRVCYRDSMKVVLFDIPSKKEIGVFEDSKQGFPACLAADGCTTLLVGQDGLIRVVNLDAKKEIARFEGHRGQVTGACFVPGDQLAISSAMDNSFFLWDARTGKEIARCDVDQPVRVCDVSKDNKVLGIPQLMPGNPQQKSKLIIWGLQ